MNLAKGLVAGLIAAIVGALLWAVIVHYAQLQVGYLAWGIGLAVGYAVAFGSSGGGPVPAVLSVILTTISILGGKFLAIQWAIDSMIGPGEANPGFAQLDVIWNLMIKTLSPIDFIFFGLGVFTAWQVAYSDPVKGEEAVSEE